MNVTFCRISPKNFSYYYYGFTSYLFRKKNSLFLPQGWRFPKFSNKTDLLRFKCLTTPTNVCQSRIISIKAEIFKQNWYYCDLNAKWLQMSIKVELYLSKPKFCQNFQGWVGPPHSRNLKKKLVLLRFKCSRTPIFQTKLVLLRFKC